MKAKTLKSIKEAKRRLMRVAGAPTLREIRAQQRKEDADRAKRGW